MLDFELTEDHKMVQSVAREIAARKVAPTITDFDRKHEFDPTLIPALKEADLLGVCIPEKYGGMGMDYISLGLVCEELEYADTSARVIFSVHIGLNSMTLLGWANEEQKEKYLVPQAKGEKLATFGLTEPGAGTDAVGIATTADKNGDHYILNGEKMWISLADVADNFLIFAWTDRDKKEKRDHSGISCFIVESEFEGVTTGSIPGKLGVRAGNTGWIAMQDVKVPKENMVGEPNEGFKIAMTCLDGGRYTVAAGSTGLIKACIDASVEYCQTRKTFETEISQHQLVKEMLAEMEYGYQAGRLLWWKAGWLKNKGVRNTRETAMAKWFCTDQAEKAAYNAVQIHGAYGFSDEYPVERFFRNSKGAAIYEGTREIQKLMQADYLLGFRKDKETRLMVPGYEE
ncbi:MAG: butyryl-CoA dehydrogenase [candidate division Zixibacteria bacterium]|nr:butyryl-CoA dehydrogenase [candidate division Zixibacteria bacterium]NIR63663.1 butyryl-CoA dehydrogenase [candidate division Zixibacteria bacterium]NIS18314.1 butyryl-CoA dehydrogenase [candidate division Zixibacteria bacterium]NIS45616.1 butyryl-CoA dehydrogenase [candidate division Zixibacteria bacterium]NIT54641.1 butyryl-CoA dehydrogenase [candidate division Zixibacteria bacterium]